MFLRLAAALFFPFILLFWSATAQNNPMKVKLKQVNSRNNLSVLLQGRNSCRSFKSTPLDLGQVSHIVWVAYGEKYDALTGATRTAPSAGAIYPLELFVIVGQDCVKDLNAGLYRYSTQDHSLNLIYESDKRKELSDICFRQEFISGAPLSVIVAAASGRTEARYGKRASRYIFMEAGHVCQNIYLAAESEGLATVEIGSFDDTQLLKLLNLDSEYVPLAVMPVGYP